MNKKQYFMLLWVICSMSVVGTAIALLTGKLTSLGFDESSVASKLYINEAMIIIVGMMGILWYSFELSLGMDFAKKIGIRFLFLETDVDFGKDLFKPAIIIGVAYAGVVLLINWLMPLTLTVLFSQMDSPNFFYQSLLIAIGGIVTSMTTLLFWLSGAALLLKKIAKNVPMSTIMPVSIVIIALLFNMALFWKFGTTLMVDSILRIIIAVILGVLFWRKGFETALLCHIIVVSILYLIAPAVVIALHA